MMRLVPEGKEVQEPAFQKLLEEAQQGLVPQAAHVASLELS